MRILHTSDWHIGKKLDGRPRFEEQKKVLSSLVGIVADNNVDIVCIAGDIYDTYMPSAESERLFFDVVSEITSAGAQIIVISGNHDDPLRLSASKNMIKCGGVYFAGAEKPSDEFSGCVAENRFCGKATLTDYGDDYFIFDKDGEEVYFAALPYPSELRMKDKISDDESYEDRVKRYISVAMRNCKDLPVILIAHIFMLGGVTTEGERAIDLGGARILPRTIIPDNVIYTALGHLHKRQIVSKERNILYSGSIMPYSFDEAGVEKSVTLFDVVAGKVTNTNVIRLDGYRQLFRITASGFEEAGEMLSRLDGYTEITVNLSRPAAADEIKSFITQYPDAFLRLSYSGNDSASTVRRNLNDKDLFLSYYQSKYGKEPSDAVLSLYLELMSEIGVENET